MTGPFRPRQYLKQTNWGLDGPSFFFFSVNQGMNGPGMSYFLRQTGAWLAPVRSIKRSWGHSGPRFFAINSAGASQALALT